MLILIAGPPGLLRDGVARIVRDLGDSTEVICADDTGIALAHSSTPDLILLDGDPDRRMGKVVGSARALMPSAPIIVLLAALDRDAMDELLALGVAGCVEKSASTATLLAALRLVLSGGVYWPSLSLAPSTGQSEPALEPPQRPKPDLQDGLTPRQIEVLALAARGESNKTIARQLGVSEGTVKVHLTAVYKALKVRTRSQAAQVAGRLERVADVQVRKALDGQLSIGRLLAHMTRQRFKAGHVLFRKRDITDALYYIVRGTVHVVELDIERGPGALLGEIGLFSSDHRRTSTARCTTECELLSVTAKDAMRIYYQDPEFAVYVTQLLTERLQHGK